MSDLMVIQEIEKLLGIALKRVDAIQFGENCFVLKRSILKRNAVSEISFSRSVKSDS